MADFRDVTNAEQDAENALQRAYKEIATATDEGFALRAITLGLVGIGRSILALGVRLDYVISDSRHSTLRG